MTTWEAALIPAVVCYHSVPPAHALQTRVYQDLCNLILTLLEPLLTRTLSLATLILRAALERGDSSRADSRTRAPKMESKPSVSSLSVISTSTALVGEAVDTSRSRRSSASETFLFDASREGEQQSKASRQHITYVIEGERSVQLSYRLHSRPRIPEENRVKDDRV